MIRYPSYGGTQKKKNIYIILLYILYFILFINNTTFFPRFGACGESGVVLMESPVR